MKFNTVLQETNDEKFKKKKNLLKTPAEVFYMIPDKNDDGFILKTAHNLMSNDDHKMWLSTKRGQYDGS